MAISRILELSQQIATNTAKINDYLVVNNLATPSFDVEAPLSSLIPSTELELEASRQSVICNCLELRQLLLGPFEHLTSYQYNQLVGQQGITRFRLAHAFPVGEETTFGELAVASGLGETHLKKIVRQGISQHIFCEPRNGIVAHTAASRLLRENGGLHNYVEWTSSESWLASAHTVEAMARYPGSEEPNETGYHVANQTDKTMFAFLSEHPDRLQRFADMMRFFSTKPGFEPFHVAKNYAWESIPDGGIVVDVGGSHGEVSFELARRFPKLNFVVQDLNELVVRNSDRQKPAEITDRVTFMVHDFHTEQTIKGADVYFFRAVLHNWSDKYATSILRNLIPALKPGAKIVINDVVAPEPTDLPRVKEESVRGYDLLMTTLLNSGDRELTQWASLFEMTDNRFDFQGGQPCPGSNLWMLVAEWQGD